ncbi:MAG: SMC-Scp complex subunit ScpB [Candidatus Aenigmatarchaeota archaeon]|nr:MAG: SMC-Scp complex subunit ScpB [Candidatus Aenigmarchaeota archaeon]
MEEKLALIEAALWISSQPLKLEELGRIAGIGSKGEVKKLLERLKQEYKRGIELVETEEGWQFLVKPELLPKVSHLAPYCELSEGCRRTLAIIIWKEPVKKSEVVKIQGNKAYSYIKKLEKLGLVKAEKSGHTSILRLTQKFERWLGKEKEEIKKLLEEAVK